MRMKIDGSYILDTIKAVKSVGREEFVMFLKSDSWLVKSVGPASVIMCAVQAPAGCMEEYDNMGMDSVGFPLSKVESFVQHSDGESIQMWMDERTLNMDDGSSHAEIATRDPESVSGATQDIPKMEYPVTTRMESNRIENFVTRAEDVAGSSYFIISGRENGLYLYSAHDNATIDQFVSKDKFERYDYSEDSTTILATDFFSELTFISDDIYVSLINDAPARYITGDLDDESSLNISYLQAPRIDESDESKIPSGVINKHQ